MLAENLAISENTAGSSLANPKLFQHLRAARPLHKRTRVTLKIEKTLGEHGTIIKLIGRIRAEHLDELRRQIAASAPELREVFLVDADAGC